MWVFGGSRVRSLWIDCLLQNLGSRFEASGGGRGG